MQNKFTMLFIIVPVHNGLTSTIKMISSLENQSYHNYNLVIVNDGSTDQTEHYFKEKIKSRIVVLKGDGSLFWGGGINLGLEYVRSVCKDDDIVAFANNDVEFLNDTIINILEEIVKEPNAISHSLVIDANRISHGSGSKIICWPLYITKFPLRGIPVNNICNLDKIAVDTASARFLIFHHNMLDIVPYIDTDNFIQYGGDDDFILSFKEKGINTYIVPRSLCVLDTKITGANWRNILSFKEFWNSLFSIKSPNCLKIKYRFGKKHCSKLVFPLFCCSITVKTILIHWRVFLPFK